MIIYGEYVQKQSDKFVKYNKIVIFNSILLAILKKCDIVRIQNTVQYKKLKEKEKWQKTMKTKM